MYYEFRVMYYLSQYFSALAYLLAFIDLFYSLLYNVPTKFLIERRPTAYEAPLEQKQVNFLVSIISSLKMNQ